MYVHLRECAVNLWFKNSQELQGNGYNNTINQFEKRKEQYIGILGDVIAEKNIPELKNLIQDQLNPLKITDQQFDAVIEGLCISLDQLELQLAVKNDLVRKIEAFRKFIVNPDPATAKSNLFQDLGEETGIRKIVEKVFLLASEEHDIFKNPGNLRKMTDQSCINEEDMYRYSLFI